MTNRIKVAFGSSSKQIRIFSLLLLLIFTAPCSGQVKTYLSKDSAKDPKKIHAGQPEINPLDGDPNFVVVRDTVSTYGPHTITRNVLQDKNGNIWFASWEGVVCYDGKLFTNFTLKEGLRHFHVFSILEDKTGNLWFGTIGGGVYRYNGKSFTVFTTRDGLVNNSIMCMLEDKAGNMWFGTDEGVSRYDGKTFTNFTTQDGLSANFINSIIQDRTGKLWFGTRASVSCYDPSAWHMIGEKSFTSFTNEKGLPFNNARSIIEDKTGNIWIGTNDGLCRYNARLTDSVMQGKSLTNFTTNFTGNIFEDKTGNLWLTGGEANGRGMTLARYDGKSFTKIITNDNQIFGITEDKSGNIWFGTAYGVCRYDGKSFDYFSEELK